MAFCLLISLTEGCPAECPAASGDRGSCSQPAHARTFCPGFRMAARGYLWVGATWVSHDANEQGTASGGLNGGACSEANPSLSSPGGKRARADMVERYFSNWLNCFVISTWQRGRPHLRCQAGGPDHLLGGEDKRLPLNEESRGGRGLQEQRQLSSPFRLLPFLTCPPPQPL